MRQATARAAGGFTLIEILVAMLVFLAAITGILALMTTALAMHRDGLVAHEVTRSLEALTEQLQVEVSAGEHLDPETGAWVDVELRQLSARSVCRVRFESRADGTGLLAWVAVAASAAGLPAAQEMPVWLSAEPTAAETVRRYQRRRAARGAAAAPDRGGR